jgi:hypothetical protein
MTPNKRKSPDQRCRDGHHKSAKLSRDQLARPRNVKDTPNFVSVLSLVHHMHASALKRGTASVAWTPVPLDLSQSLQFESTASPRYGDVLTVERGDMHNDKFLKQLVQQLTITRLPQTLALDAYDPQELHVGSAMSGSGEGAIEFAETSKGLLGEIANINSRSSTLVYEFDHCMPAPSGVNIYTDGHVYICPRSD